MTSYPPNSPEPLIFSVSKDRGFGVHIRYQVGYGAYADFGDENLVNVGNDGVIDFSANVFEEDTVIKLYFYAASSDLVFVGPGIVSVIEWGTGLRSVKSIRFGTFSWGQAGGAWQPVSPLLPGGDPVNFGCPFLTSVPDHLPFNAEIEAFTAMFFGCKRLNCSLENWDITHSGEFGQMFKHCETFNGSLANWDFHTSQEPEWVSTPNFSQMFQYCYAFQQDLSNWDLKRMSEDSFNFPPNLPPSKYPQFKQS
ncbi:BspA family leucine-rich repeat surface protein [Acinetobacter junii]|uniref:DUF285 domain-containing protein n=1 Tax=Acinetobacter junii TaxID=40215 RepID=A0AAW5R9K4_ACIJU|nr:BspA family leucine-rich repeat surface protein [Acinetobacter junii]MCU4395781.1 DUF285 domain-containing protein [Acinetobacter junii]